MRDLKEKASVCISTPCKKKKSAIFPERMEGPQTGPKGVIADHAHYERAKREEQQRARAEYNARMLAKAPMTTTYAQDEAEKARSLQQGPDELVLEHRRDTDDEEDDLLLQDEEIMQRYREQRLRELKQISNQKIREQHRLFGTVQDISANDYVAAIDKEWRTVPVIVHLYDEVTWENAELCIDTH